MAFERLGDIKASEIARTPNGENGLEFLSAVGIRHPETGEFTGAMRYRLNGRKITVIGSAVFGEVEEGQEPTA